MIDLLPLPLETSRLVIREFAHSDRAAVDAIYTDERVIKYVGTSPFRPRPGEALEAAFERVRHSAQRPAAIARLNGPVLGALSLQAYDTGFTGDYELTVALLEHARGQRIGSEILAAVLDALRGIPDVRRVITRVSPCNEASLRLVQAFGFTNIGERQNIWSNRTDAVFALQMDEGAA